MTDQPGTTTKVPPTKYTLLLDPATRAYQRHLRRNTDINFSDFIRALIARVAADKTLEAEIMAACGGGYEDDEPLPRPVASPARDAPAVSLTLPDQEEILPTERDIAAELQAAAISVEPESPVAEPAADDDVVERAAEDPDYDVTTPDVPRDGFWGDVDEYAAA